MKIAFFVLEASKKARILLLQLLKLEFRPKASPNSENQYCYLNKFNLLIILSLVKLSMLP